MILIFGWGFLGVLYFRVFWNWGIVIILMFIAKTVGWFFGLFDFWNWGIVITLMYYFLTVQSISPYFLPRGITVRIIYVYVYILWVEKFFFPTLYSGQVWLIFDIERWNCGAVLGYLIFWNWGIVITLLFNAECCGAVIGLFI